MIDSKLYLGIPSPKSKFDRSDYDGLGRRAQKQSWREEAETCFSGAHRGAAFGPELNRQGEGREERRRVPRLGRNSPGGERKRRERMERGGGDKFSREAVGEERNNRTFTRQ